MTVLGRGAAALSVSEQGFGCMGITAFYGKPMPDDDAVALLLRAFELGCTFWDTAEVYRTTAEDGTTIYNESVVGKAIARLKGKRNELQIATKYMPHLHGAEMTPESCLSACRASCARLGVESVDLYYVHRFHSGVPVEEQARAMQAVRDAGLANRIGVSEFSPRNLRAFHALCPVTAVQQEWSLMNRDLEADLVPTCRELGIGVVAYSPLCRKLLSGELRTVNDLAEGDMRASRYGRLEAQNIEANALLADRVAALAREHGLTAAQLSPSWVSNQGSDVVAIPGTTSIAHLEDNLASRGHVLSGEERALIAAAVPAEEVAGKRYATEAGNKLTYKGNL